MKKIYMSFSEKKNEEQPLCIFYFKKVNHELILLYRGIYIRDFGLCVCVSLIFLSQTLVNIIVCNSFTCDFHIFFKFKIAFFLL